MSARVTKEAPLDPARSARRAHLVRAARRSWFLGLSGLVVVPSLARAQGDGSAAPTAQAIEPPSVDDAPWDAAGSEGTAARATPDPSRTPRCTGGQWGRPCREARLRGMRASTAIGSLVGSGMVVGVGLIWLADANASTSTHDRDQLARRMLAGVGVFATGQLTAAVLNLRIIAGNAGGERPLSRAAPIVSLVGASAMVAGIASRRGIVALPGAALAALPMWGQPRRLRRAWAASPAGDDRPALVVLPHVELAPFRGSLTLATAW